MDEIAAEVFWEKATESLAGAEGEFANARYHNCANRCYYACFQAAIVALMRAGVRPVGKGDEWGHDFVQSQFVGQFVNRRKVYPARLRDVLSRHFALRCTADYTTATITAIIASRMMERTREFLQAIERRDGTV